MAPDETTFEYLRGRPHAPQGEEWDRAVAHWRTLVTDDDAVIYMYYGGIVVDGQARSAPYFETGDER